MGDKEASYVAKKILQEQARKYDAKKDDEITSSNWSFGEFFRTVFLPQGYPHSVSNDYLEYQKWDTAQALMSSLNGALATEAVLQGAGVGDEKSTALAAALTWIVKDGIGMIGRIAFSYKVGTQLGPNSKKWRLRADVLNDLAYFVDLSNPFLPGFFLPLVCMSSLMRCVVGVAGGVTRATIAEHQAKNNNLGDVVAKDGSQETMVNLIAMVLSLIMLPLVSGNVPLVWALYAIFTFLHMFFNYKAVRSLVYNSLNYERLEYVTRTWRRSGVVPDVETVNKNEKVFFEDDVENHFGERLLDAPDGLEPLYEVEDSHIYHVNGRRKYIWMAQSDHEHDTSRREIVAVAQAIMTADGNDGNIDCEDFLRQLEDSGYTLQSNDLAFQDFTYDKKKCT